MRECCVGSDLCGLQPGTQVPLRRQDDAFRTHGKPLLLHLGSRTPNEKRYFNFNFVPGLSDNVLFLNYSSFRHLFSRTLLHMKHTFWSFVVLFPSSKLQTGFLVLIIQINAEIKRLTLVAEPFNTPGPGAYSPERAPPVNAHCRAPSYTMGGRTRYRGVDAVPAPNRSVALSMVAVGSRQPIHALSSTLQLHSSLSDGLPGSA